MEFVLRSKTMTTIALITGRVSPSSVANRVSIVEIIPQSYQWSELGLSVFILIICPLLFSDKGKHSGVTQGKYTNAICLDDRFSEENIKDAI